MKAVLTLLVCVVAAPLFAQSQASQTPQEETAPEPRRRTLRFLMDEHPSIQLGDAVQFEFQLKTQADWTDFSTRKSGDPKEGFDLHRARTSVQGTVLKVVEFQIERELNDSTDPWRDVFVNARPLRALQLQAGRFKIPFSQEQLTGGLDLDLAYRSLAATYLAPGRDVGVMAHGTVFQDVFKYQLGVFQRGGENVRESEHSDPQSQQTKGARLVVKPWDRKGAFRPLRDLAFGAGYTSSRLPEGLNSLRGNTTADEALFPRVYVKGLRQRLGGELQWRTGPLSFSSELMRIADQRRGQGIRDEDLPDVVARGWYLTGTWLMTGERKTDDVKVARPFLQGGAGAFELAGRLEDIQLGDAGSKDTTRLILPSPRSAYLQQFGDRVATIGLNWYLNRFIKVQANLIREQRREGMRYDDSGQALSVQSPYWSRTFRLQFGL